MLCKSRSKQNIEQATPQNDNVGIDKQQVVSLIKKIQLPSCVSFRLNFETQISKTTISDLKYNKTLHFEFQIFFKFTIKR